MTTRRSGGNVSSRTNRRTSHIRKPASSWSSRSRLPIHRAPQCPSDITIGRSSSPAAVSAYELARPSPVRRTTPNSSSVRSRRASRVGDIRGRPRRISLNRVLPQSSSRTTSGVHRSHRTSAPRATVQNWP